MGLHTRCSAHCMRGTSTHQCRTPAELAASRAWCENCTHTLPMTGVRYAWSDSPCCGGQPASRNCPVNFCPISTVNSTLVSAVPFVAKVLYTNDTDEGVGICECSPPQKCS